MFDDGVSQDASEAQMLTQDHRNTPLDQSAEVAHPENP
jgi:hypothetical protein